MLMFCLCITSIADPDLTIQYITDHKKSILLFVESN